MSIGFRIRHLYAPGTDQPVEYVISMTNFKWPNEPTIFFCRPAPPADFPVSESNPIIYASQRLGCILDSGLVLEFSYISPPPCLTPCPSQCVSTGHLTPPSCCFPYFYFFHLLILSPYRSQSDLFKI